MNTESVTRILDTLAHLAKAPAEYKQGLADLIDKTGRPIAELTIGDFLKLSAAHAAAYKTRRMFGESVAEHCLFNGNGSIDEKIALIAGILGERAKRLGSQRQDIDSAVTLARRYLEKGYSGATALMNGYGILLNSAHPKQAA